MMRGLVAAALALFAFATPAWALSDLVISELRVTPASAETGASIEIQISIQNVGDATARAPADLAIVRSTVTPHHEGVAVTAWTPARDLMPGSVERTVMRVPAPAGAPAAGYLCAEVDLVNAVRESNERNNRRCVNFHAVQAKPNLVIRSITQGGVTGISRAMRIVIQNIGRAPAGEFYVEAFDAPAHRYTLTLAPYAIVAHTGSARAVYVTSLAAGESRSLDVWFALPGTPAPGSRHTIDIVVDGCNPALSPTLPRFCYVDETVEADNLRRIVVVAP